MNFLKTLLGFWISLAIPYFLAVIFLWMAFRSGGMNAVIVPLIIAITVHLIFWSYLKSKILAALPKNFTWKAIAPENCPLLDIDTLDRYSQQLESLGFISLKDFQQTTESGGNPSDFARLFSHPQLNCFAEVSQSFPLNQDPIPITCTILSFMDGDWTFATAKLKPNGFFYMWRRPKALWTYYPAATITDLLQVHLERRQQIVDTLGVSILLDLSWKLYCNQAYKITIHRRIIVEEKPILIALVEATLFELKPSSEWMGDYPKLAARKRAVIG